MNTLCIDTLWFVWGCLDDETDRFLREGFICARCANKNNRSLTGSYEQITPFRLWRSFDLTIVASNGVSALHALHILLSIEARIFTLGYSPFWMIAVFCKDVWEKVGLGFFLSAKAYPRHRTHLNDWFVEILAARTWFNFAMSSAIVSSFHFPIMDYSGVAPFRNECGINALLSVRKKSTPRSTRVDAC